MQARVGLLVNAYIHDHCLRYRHNFALFYQLLGTNLFTHYIICYLEKASSETYGPRVYFPLYKFPIYYFPIFYFLFYKPKNTKNIYFIVYLSLSDLTFASDREGIDNPFIALGASVCLFVKVLVICAFVSYWIDTLVLN